MIGLLAGIPCIAMGTAQLWEHQILILVAGRISSSHTEIRRYTHYPPGNIRQYSGQETIKQPQFGVTPRVQLGPPNAVGAETLSMSILWARPGCWEPQGGNAAGDLGWPRESHGHDITSEVRGIALHYRTNH